MINEIENKCFFLKSVISIKDLPDESISEFCFWGRSNVGKSSLLNSLIKINIAKTSKTPGRTTSLNFFQVNSAIRFVDFPGYGYAKKSKLEIYKWNELILNYLTLRKNIISVFLLIDSRHGMKKIDLEAMRVLESLKIHFFLTLTKIDKITNSDLINCYSRLNELILNNKTVDSKVLSTSSKKNKGIKELKKTIISLV